MPGGAGERRLARPADLQRGRERRGDRRRGARAAAAGAAGCWSSTTPRPTAPARSPTGSPPSDDDVAVLHRAAKQGLGPAYVAGFRAGARRRRGAGRADGRRLLPRPGRPAAAARGGRPTPTWCSARATSPAAGSPTGGRCRRAISRGGSAYARAVLGRRDPRPDRRLQGLSPRGAGGDRPRDDRRRSATRSRSRRPTGRSGPASGSSRCRSPSATAAWASRR